MQKLMKRYISLLFFFFLSLPAFVWGHEPVKHTRSLKESLQVNADSLKLEAFGEAYRMHLDSIWQSVSAEDPLQYIFPKHIVLDPGFYKLYLPVTYYKDAVMLWFHPETKTRELMPKQDRSSGLLEVDKTAFSNFAANNRFMNERLFELYNHKPWAIEKWDYKINSLKLHKIGKEELVKPKASILDIFKPDPIEVKPEETPVNVKLIKPRLWKYGGNGSIQFSQLHVSDNWYKGGESNINLQSVLVFNFNYNNQDYLQFDNSVELREGFNTTPSDTINKVQMNTDVFRLSSKLGIKAAKNWYYTIAMQFNSQLFTNYATNTRNRISSLLSPGYLSVSLGMDYKLNKKNLNLSVLMSPIAYNLRFVKDRKVDETKFGIERGKFSLNTYGSEITTNFTWKINSYISYSTRLYAFTNYERAEMSFENTIDLAINRYFSTRFFSHIRFDDNVKRKEGESYFQFKDIFSFGLSYSW